MILFANIFFRAFELMLKGNREELDITERLHFHALEKEMATHSSVLAWRIPGTGEPGGLPSMGSNRVGHGWRDLAAARSNIHLQFSVFLLFLHSLGIRFILLSKNFFTWIIPPFLCWSFYLFSVNFMCLILRRVYYNLLLADRQRGGDWGTLDTKFHETPKT